MRRRKFLTVTAAATALSTVAGCTQTGDRSAGDPTDTNESADSPGSQPGGTNTTATNETDAPNTETGSVGGDGDGESGSAGDSDQGWGSGGTMNGVEFSFSSQSPECGQGTDHVDISFDEEAGEVVLDGVIRGSDLCKRATLQSVDYDESADELTVVVETTEQERCEDDEVAAGQCIVDIEYEATFSFDGDVPATASVSHGDRYGATAGHGSASAGTPATDTQ